MCFLSAHLHVSSPSASALFHGHRNLEPNRLLWLLQLSCKHVRKQATKKLNRQQRLVICSVCVCVFFLMPLLAGVGGKNSFWRWKTKCYQVEKNKWKWKHYQNEKWSTTTKSFGSAEVFPADPSLPDLYGTNPPYNLPLLYLRQCKHLVQTVTSIWLVTQ